MQRPTVQKANPDRRNPTKTLPVGPFRVQQEPTPVQAGVSIPRCNRSPHPEQLATLSP